MQNSNKYNKAVKALSFGEGLGEVAVQALSFGEGLGEVAVKALSFGEGLGEVAVQAPLGGLGALGGTWRSEGQCTCGGTLTLKYEYIADRSIKLRIKPHKKRFNLYARRWGEWDKPLAELEQVLAAHGLMSK